MEDDPKPRYMYRSFSCPSKARFLQANDLGGAAGLLASHLKLEIAGRGFDGLSMSIDVGYNRALLMIHGLISSSCARCIFDTSKANVKMGDDLRHRIYPFRSPSSPCLIQGGM